MQALSRFLNVKNRSGTRRGVTTQQRKHLASEACTHFFRSKLFVSNVRCKQLDCRDTIINTAFFLFSFGFHITQINSYTFSVYVVLTFSIRINQSNSCSCATWQAVTRTNIKQENGGCKGCNRLPRWIWNYRIYLHMVPPFNSNPHPSSERWLAVPEVAPHQHGPSFVVSTIDLSPHYPELLGPRTFQLLQRTR